VKRSIGAVVLGLACFLAGALFQRYYDSRTLRSAQAQAPKPAAPESQVVEDRTGVNPANIRFEHEPLWAYGFETPPKPGDKAQPQAPPTRNLRPNQDPAEQTRPRRVEGSGATY